MLKIDGFDEAILGVGERINQRLLIYSREMIVATLMERDGMTEEDAEEYVDFNIAGAWMGEGTPMILADFDESLEEDEAEDDP